MNKKRNTILTAILAFLASVATGVIFSCSTYADTVPVVEKWTYAQYYNCFQSELLNKEIKRDEASGRVSDVIFKSNSAIYDYNYLPSEGYYTNVNNLLGSVNTISCRQVLNGIDNKISGILEQAGVSYAATWQDNLSETDELMDKMGYKTKDAEAEYFFDIQMQVHERTVTQNVLTILTGPSVTERDYTQGSARIQGTRDANGNIAWKVIDSNFGNALKVKIDNSNKMTITIDTAGTFSGCLSSGDVKSNPIQLTNNIEEIKNKIANEMKDWGAVENCSNTSGASSSGLVLQTIDTTSTYTFSPDTSQLIDEGRGSIFTNDGSEATAKSSIQKLGHDLASLDLTEDERYDLYSWYLKKAIPNYELSTTGALKCRDKVDESGNSTLTPINLKNNGKWLKYYVDLTGVDVATAKYMDLQANASFGKINLQTVIDWMNSHSAEDISDEECTKIMQSGSSDLNPDTSSGVWDTTVADASSDEADCWNSAGAGGYLVCWVIQFAQHTITAIYDNIITNFLEFRSSFLEINSGNAVYTAWQTFQSFANVAFVIVLLIVIFSQLTGVGIDNLGIKRVLPKLIIAAVLINLSYIICMLFVDLSNITGTGLNSLFANIPVIANSAAEPTTGSKVLSIGVETAVASAVGALGVVGVGLTGGVVVIPLLLGLISTLVGILFFFVILGARQAAIVILVVVSPVAFACYMLPNTKSIFDKWLKLFEAMLLLFPICGLLMGGSAFASKILITLDQGFLGSLIAMLVGVIPFFFIPSLLRSSFSAMGNLGAKITGFGQNLGRGLRNTAANSNLVKDTETRLAAGRKSNGELNAAGKLREKLANSNPNSRFNRITGIQRAASRARARGLMNYEKMKDEIDFASRPDLITSEAEARRFGRSQSAADAELVSTGVANRTGDLKEFDLDIPEKSTFKKGTLAYAAMEAANSGDVAKQYAITERMLAQGHHGAEAYRQVLASLEKQGNLAALENFAKAGKNSRHFNDLKSGARSTFDYVNAITDNAVTRDEDNNLLSAVKPSQTLQDYTNKVNYSNMSESQIINMDREELERAAERIKTKRANGDGFSEAEQSLINQANRAFRNDRLRGGAKERNQILAAEIAGIPEQERQQIMNGTITVQHDNNKGDQQGTPTSAPIDTQDQGGAPAPSNAEANASFNVNRPNGMRAHTQFYNNLNNNNNSTPPRPSNNQQFYNQSAQNSQADRNMQNNRKGQNR